MNQRHIKLCFVAVHTYPVINPTAPGLFGGIETISWDFAREIAKLPETEVSFVVNHRLAPRKSVVDGVTVIEGTDFIEWCRQDLSSALRNWREHRCLPWSKLGRLALEAIAYSFHRITQPNSPRQWQAPSYWVTQTDADIYIAFGVNTQATWTQACARSIGRSTILCLMSDSDLDPRFHADTDYVNQYGVSATMARSLIHDSQGIVSQTRFQQEQLRTVWQRESVVVANLLDLETWDANMQSPLPPGIPEVPFVLWVGRADRFHKRPLEMVHVIRSNPNIPFVMVMNPSDPQVLNEIKSYAFPNLTLIPQLTTREMAAAMRCAAIFASTGSLHFEGFPSVFLQAAASSTPIVSLEVSADWISTSGAGICARGNQEVFSQTITRFVNDRTAPDVVCYAKNGRQFVELHHDARKQAAKLLAYARQVAEAVSQD